MLTVPPAAPAEPVARAADLPIVHEDDYLIVIDKPAGLVVHPAPGHESGTLVNALIAHCGPACRASAASAGPASSHRLDKDTSGLIVVAKNDVAHQGLTAQFADHGRSGPLERAYAAVVWGLPQPRGRDDPRQASRVALPPGERSPSSRTRAGATPSPTTP